MSGHPLHRNRRKVLPFLSLFLWSCYYSFSLEDPGLKFLTKIKWQERIELCKILDDEHVAIRTGRNEWFVYSLATNKLVRMVHWPPEILNNVVDYFLKDGREYILYLRSGKYSVSLLTRNMAMAEIKIVIPEITFVPSRLFLSETGSDIFISEDICLREKDRFHLHRYGMDGIEKGSFAPVVALDKRIPIFSPYYMATINRYPPRGFIVTYFYLPTIFLVDESNGKSSLLDLEKMEKMQSYYSYDRKINFGMDLPKKRLLGSPAIDSRGRIWVPVIKQKETGTAIRIIDGTKTISIIEEDTRDIFGLIILERESLVIAHSLDELIVYRMNRKKYFLDH